MKKEKWFSAGLLVLLTGCATHGSAPAPAEASQSEAKGEQSEAAKWVEAEPRPSELDLEKVEHRIVLSLDEAVDKVRNSGEQRGDADPVERLVGLLQSSSDYEVRIEGHTDSVGDGAYNQRLSQRRAEIVRDALVQYGIDEGRILAVGHGETAPVATNATPQGRRQNRRIEVLIVNLELPPARDTAQLTSY